VRICEEVRTHFKNQLDKKIDHQVNRKANESFDKYIPEHNNQFLTQMNKNVTVSNNWSRMTVSGPAVFSLLWYYFKA
jgi:transcriptional regulatory protein LevR